MSQPLDDVWDCSLLCQTPLHHCEASSTSLHYGLCNYAALLDPPEMFQSSIVPRRKFNVKPRKLPDAKQL